MKWKYATVKFAFSKKATKFDKIFTVDLTLTTYCQIDGEDFIIFVAFLENTNFIIILPLIDIEFPNRSAITLEFISFYWSDISKNWHFLTPLLPLQVLT